MFGMTSCWFCHELIEDADLEEPAPVVEEPAPVVEEPAPVVRTPEPARQAVVARSPTPVQVVERTVRPSEPVFAARRRRTPGGALLLWILLAVLLTLVLLFVEMGLPQLPATSPARVELESHAFPKLGFSIDNPADWSITQVKNRVSFFARGHDPGKPTRGLRVSLTGLRFKDVDDEAADRNRRRVRDYQALDSHKDTLDGRDAFVFVFTGNDLRFEQWWVDPGKKKKETLRLEFWSRLADDDASATNGRIARTLRVP